MSFPPRSNVRAVHDIRRGPHTVVGHGRRGRIVESHPSWFETTYTVQFPGDLEHRGPGVILVGLNEADIQPG
jgi:hypothetical protein